MEVWRQHLGDGLAASGEDAQTPNIIQQSYATFVYDGYTYNVWASNWRPVIYNGGAVDDKSLPMPVKPGVDPEAEKALEAAIAQLAPNLGSQCFWRQVQGDWSDLAALGIGDPRGALPAGFQENGLALTRFDAPAAGCTSVVPPYVDQVNAYAFFTGSNGAQFSINVNGSKGSGVASPGSIDDFNASWSNGDYYFSVYGNGDGINRDVIRKVAQALDPKFDSVCFLDKHDLSEAEVAALGIHAPALPHGFRIDQATFIGVEGTAPCGTSNDGYTLRWMMLNMSVGGYIEAGITHGPIDPSVGIGTLLDTSLLWKDDAGNTYHVSSLKMEVDRDTLIEVAKSMDPNFDESRLEKPGNGGIVPPDRGGSPVPIAEPARD